jgi:hypothetical protein
MPAVRRRIELIWPLLSVWPFSRRISNQFECPRFYRVIPHFFQQWSFFPAIPFFKVQINCHSLPSLITAFFFL